MRDVPADGLVGAVATDQLSPAVPRQGTTLRVQQQQCIVAERSDERSQKPLRIIAGSKGGLDGWHGWHGSAVGERSRRQIGKNLLTNVRSRSLDFGLGIISRTASTTLLLLRNAALAMSLNARFHRLMLSGPVPVRISSRQAPCFYSIL